MAAGAGSASVPVPVRTMVVWCPDWPVIAAELAAGVSAATPVAVLHANRVVACSPSARQEGVRRGLRRREAQSRCPRLTVVAHDPDRDARAFEPVLATVEEVVAQVAVVRPGTCAFVARGPARFFGGEERAAERVVEHLAQGCAVESQVGIADGLFAATLAARTGRIVAPGRTPRFLAGQPVEALGRPALTSLLHRLGVRTLGDFAALPAGDVLARFGFEGMLAHRLAGGRDHRPLAVRRPPADLAVTETYDAPLDRVDTAAFAARSLAERLHAGLTGHGLACTRLGIEAVTAHGQELHRVWRHDGLLTATAIADRVRWQLDGWLSRPAGGRGGAEPAVGWPDSETGTGTGSGRSSSAPARPTAGIVRLRLVPEGVLAHAGLQPGLWGEVGPERDRAHRALSRVQGILGPESVVTAVLGGGRSPADQARLVPWGDERIPARPAGPWPGRLPPPAPALVPVSPLAAAVTDATGAPVLVTARLGVSAPPARIVIGTAPPARIVGWAGPWPVDERWWTTLTAPGPPVGGGERSPWSTDPAASGEARRAARFQVCLADGRALLLVLSGGRWSVEAVYD